MSSSPRAIAKRLYYRWTRKMTRQRMRPFLERHASDRLTLDIGSGPGPYGYLFPNRVGIDITPSPGLSVVADVAHIPVRSGSLPLVLATELLEHTTDPQRAVDEMLRVLEPGGKLILTTRFCFPIHDAPGDFFRFTKYGLQHLLRDCASVEIHEEASNGATMGILLQRLDYQTNLRGGLLATAIIHLIARSFRMLDLIISREYGDGRKSRSERGILSSGYYVVGVK